MFDSLIAKVGAILTSLALFFGIGHPTPVGVDLPEGVAVFETSLASGIQASSTSMTLTSATVRGGTSLSGYNCFAIDEGSAQAEYVCGTASGTVISSLERGLSPADGVTEDDDLKFSHRRGASVKITDFPLIQRIKAQNAGEATIPNTLTYSSGVTPLLSGDLADREYVLSVVTGGTVSFDKTVIPAVAGETISTSSVVYLNRADGEWYKADADLEGTYVDRILGFSQGAGTDGVSITGGVLTHGLASVTAFNDDEFYFLSTTAGGVTTSTTTQPIGYAVSATELYFDPNILDSSKFTPTTFSATSTFTGQVRGGAKLYLVASSTFTGATAPQAAFINSANTLSLSNASHASTSLFSGFVVSNTSAAATGTIQTEGIVTGFSGLTTGLTYYTTNSNGTISTTAGTFASKVGVAVSPTELLIQKLPLSMNGTFTFGATENATVTLGYRPTSVDFYAVQTNGAADNTEEMSQGGWTAMGGNYSVGYSEGSSDEVNHFISTTNAFSCADNNSSMAGQVINVSNVGFTIAVTDTGTHSDCHVYWKATGSL